VETIFYLLFTIIGIITGWILRGCVGRRTDDRDGIIGFSSLNDDGGTEQAIVEITSTIEQAKRTNEAATETIKKMQDLLHNIRDNHTDDGGGPVFN
jgi:hypothetical protein